MPLCTIHLLSLSPTTTITQFLNTLRTKTSLKPLTIAKVIRWIILPTSLSTTDLLAQNIHWDILLILPNTSPLPNILQAQIQHSFTLQAGVPSRLLQDFPSKNERLLHPQKTDIPPLTNSLDSPLLSSSSQDLSLTQPLQSWISSPNAPTGAVSMLNLLSFAPGKKDEYLKYGAEFAKSTGSRRGGEAKIVGSVVHDNNNGNGNGNVEEEGKGWDEIALAHYPSLEHFADMLASADYQEVNQKWRVGSLRDTCILCTSELGLDEGRKGGGAKL